MAEDSKVVIVVLDDYPDWQQAFKALPELSDVNVVQVENDEFVKTLINLRPQVVIGRFDSRSKINQIFEILPDCQLFVTLPGEFSSQVIDLIMAAPVGILRSPPQSFELSDLISGESKNTKLLNAPLFDFKVSFTSKEADALKNVFPLASWLLQSGLIDADQQRGLQLAFQEALTNSLEHGNLELDSSWKDEFDEDGYDRYSKERRARLNDLTYANRLITVVTTCRDSKLVIEIQDQGRGFKYDQATQKPVQSDACHGRGLSLISAYMDTVAFDNGGSKIILEKRINSTCITNSV